MHLWRTIGPVAAMAIFWSPVWYHARTGTLPSYIPATVLLAAAVGTIVAVWGSGRAPVTNRLAIARSAAVAVALIAAVLLLVGAWRWMDRAVWNPLGSGGDMLLVVHEAMRRLLRGRDPYALYAVPWEAPLPYGPMLWAPFLVAQALRVDLRVVSVAGMLFVPLWCGIAGAFEAARSRLLSAFAWLGLLAAFVLHPAFLQFTPTAHTASYWPLLLLFAALAAAGRWTAAGAALGLLVAARSTMVSIVPVFGMAVFIRDTTAFRKASAACALVVAATLLPFIVWNPATFWYGMVASYPRIMTTVVWTDPGRGLIDTIGLTGWLVSHGYGRLVVPVQIAALTSVYTLAWRALVRGSRPVPWMALALMAFSMTTLWPVYYIYLDVFLLLASAAIVETLDLRSSMRIVPAWAASVVVVVAVTAVALRAQAPGHPSLQFESARDRRALLGGFAPFSADAPFAWVWGLNSSFIVPRSTASDADIVITLQPVIPAGGPAQRIVCLLNGVMLGTVDAGSGWQSVRFHAPRNAWRIGSNTLDLRCGSSARPIDVGLGDDPRHMSLAVKQIDVQPSAAPGLNP